MTTRCKVKCSHTGQTLNGGSTSREILHTAKFTAVYDSNPNSENGKFFKWTPSATFDLGAITGQFFEVGKEYYVDFIPVEEKIVA